MIDNQPALNSVASLRLFDYRPVEETRRESREVGEGNTFRSMAGGCIPMRTRQ